MNKKQVLEKAKELLRDNRFSTQLEGMTYIYEFFEKNLPKVWGRGTK